MDDDRVLRQKARDAIRLGLLPGRPPDRMWGGPGSGAHCAVCSQPVTSNEIGYEVEFYDQSGQVGRTQNVHVVCFAAWEEERDGPVPEVNGCLDRGAGNGRHLPSTGGGGTIMTRERDPDRQGTSK